VALSVSVPAPTRRVLAAASAALLALLTVLTVVAPPAQAAAPTTSDPAAAGAGWLARQFVDGDHLEVVSAGQTFPDAGLTLDAVLGFAAAGVAGDRAEAAMAWVGRPANLETYVGNGTTDSFAGALAKLSLTAQVQGLDPTAFGSERVDLLARLRERLTASGRFSDKSSFGDFSNGFSQSYAVLTLVRAGSVPPGAVSFLAGSVCPGGGFPLFFEQTPCVPDPDTTALAVQALAAAGDRAAAATGVRWLVSDQQPDGSFGGGSSSDGPNTNSTGLVGQALRAADSTAAANRAAAYVRSLQSGCAATVARRGAIAHDGSGFVAATAVRATPQALLGLSGPGLLTLDGTGSEPAAPVLACAAPPTSSAPATPSPSPTRSSTAPPTTTAPPPTSQAAAPVPTPSTSPAALGGTLPNTGASPLPVVWIGLGLLAGGTALVFLGRRRRPAKP
jgi:LPXTG-motif cell wall-anchored protein